MENQDKYKTLVDNTFLMSVGTLGSKVLRFSRVRFYAGVLSPSDYGTADLIVQITVCLFLWFPWGSQTVCSDLPQEKKWEEQRFFHRILW